MATLQIDGIGKVNIDDAFLRMTPEQQASEVDAIAAQVKGGGAPAGAASPTYQRPDPRYQTEQDAFIENLMAQKATEKPTDVVQRGSILPVGQTREGQPTLALPGFLEGPRQTIMDLLDGKKTARDLSGREIFELGSLFAAAPGGGPAGTGPGIARAAAEREALAARPAPTGATDAAAGAARPAAPAADDAALAAAARPAAPSPVPAPGPTATTEEFRTAAKSFYKQMEDSGVEVAPVGTKKLSEEVTAAAEKANIDPTLHPRGTAALKRVQAVADKPLSFERLDQLRQIVKEAGSSPDKGERRIAGILTDKLDDFVEKLGGTDLAGGDATTAKAAVGQARELWSKVAKLDQVADLVERARISAPNFSASGFENALRTEFRSLAKNKREMRSYTAGEQEAIKRVAKGTLGSNAARAGGKLAPTGVVSGTLSGGLGAAIGTAIGIGPVAGAAIATGGGFTARALATKLTQRHVAQLETLIRNGGESRAANAALTRARSTLQSLEDAANAAATPATSAATE